MDKYLKEQEKHFKKLEESGFTKEQVNALENFLAFHKGAVIDYLKDIELDALKKDLEQDIRTHRHLENGGVTQPY